MRDLRPSTSRTTLAAVLLALLSLVACNDSDGDPPGTTTPEPSVASPSPTTESPPNASPTAPVPTAAAPVELDALLIEWASPGWLRPIDAATGDDVPGYEPIDVEQAASTQLSRDGRTLALSIVPRSTQFGSDSTLYLLDLATWTRKEVEGVPSGLSPAAWSPDGSTLYALRSGCTAPGTEGRCLSAWHHQLWAIAVASAQGRLLAETDFWWGGLRSSPDGASLYTLGHRSEICCGIDVSTPPFVAVIDVEEGRVTAEVPLPRVAIGQWFERRQDGEINVIAWPGWTLAPAGDRIYVVDPESTRISVVDLDRLEVEQVARLTPPESPLERLGGWLRDRVVTRAEAKGGLYHTRQVEVSADGTRLYITGTDGDTCASNPGLDCARVPLGLLVVDTATMQLVHEEPLVDAFVLTPDGSRILATGTYSDWSDHDSDDETVLGYTGTGLKILDAETYEVLAHVRPDGLLWSHPAITRDGRFAHATIEGAGLDAAQEENAACTEACTLLLVINLERGEIVAERSFDAYYVQPIGVAYTSAGSE